MKFYHSNYKLPWKLGYLRNVTTLLNVNLDICDFVSMIVNCNPL